MKKIVMSLVSVVVFALAACAPAANTNNPLANLTGTGAGAGAGLAGGAKLTKAQVIKWADCVLSKAGPEAKVSIEQVKALWSQIPDSAFETSVTPAQVEAMSKAYAQLGCSLL